MIVKEICQSLVWLFLSIVWLVSLFIPSVFATAEMELVKELSLRILFQPQEVFTHGITTKERDLIERFAKENQLVPEWVAVEEQQQLISALINGNGDIIIGHNKSLAVGVSDHIRMTYPWTISRQQLVGRANTSRISSLHDLAGRQIALKKSSPFWLVLEGYLAKSVAVDLHPIPESLNLNDIMRSVASGKYDLTVVNSEFLKESLSHHSSLAVFFDFPKTELRAWLLRLTAQQLHGRLNEFLHQNYLSMIVSEPSADDFPGIKKRKILRVITYLSPSTYFFNDGSMQGFEYELIKQFARSQGLGLDVVIAHSHEQMYDLLIQGAGDIIIAPLPQHSFDDDQVKMTVAYNYAAPVVVGRNINNGFFNVGDLAGIRMALSAYSPYQGILKELQDQGSDFKIVDVDQGVSTHAVLHRVSQGSYDMTILASHRLKAELQQQQGLRPLFALGQPVAQSWAVRSYNYKLLAAVNAYIKQEYRGNIYNVLRSRYLSSPRQFVDKRDLFDGVSILSPYDDLIKTSAEKHNFDWRLIIAQIYQESQFDPEAISYAGAQGLMQLMPETANELGVNDLHDPETNITAGVKYMESLRERFEQELLLEEKTWFTLAAYNAGFNRVRDARVLAESLGFDSNRWFANVEKAMLLLSQPNSQTNGKRRCRCRQTVIYVKNIRSLYYNYVELTEASKVVSTEKLSNGVGGI